MKLTVKTQGFAELDKAMDEFSKATSRNVMRRAAAAGGEIIAARARQLAPVDQGDLRDSIVVTTKLGPRQKGLSRNSRSEAEVYVGPSGDERYRAHFVEFGTQPGKRSQTRKEAAAAGLKVGASFLVPSSGAKQGKSGRQSYRTHPGNKPQPFMRPAFDEKSSAALDKIREQLAVEIDRATARAQAKALKAKG